MRNAEDSMGRKQTADKRITVLLSPQHQAAIAQIQSKEALRGHTLTRSDAIRLAILAGRERLCGDGPF
jgi:hypothetical protein